MPPKKDSKKAAEKKEGGEKVATEKTTKPAEGDSKEKKPAKGGKKGKKWPTLSPSCGDGRQRSVRFRSRFMLVRRKTVFKQDVELILLANIL